MTGKDHVYIWDMYILPSEVNQKLHEGQGLCFYVFLMSSHIMSTGTQGFWAAPAFLIAAAKAHGSTKVSRNTVKWTNSCFNSQRGTSLPNSLSLCKLESHLLYPATSSSSFSNAECGKGSAIALSNAHVILTFYAQSMHTHHTHMHGHVDIYINTHIYAYSFIW